MTICPLTGIPLLVIASKRNELTDPNIVLRQLSALSLFCLSERNWLASASINNQTITITMSISIIVNHLRIIIIGEKIKFLLFLTLSIATYHPKSNFFCSDFLSRKNIPIATKICNIMVLSLYYQ